MYGSYFRAARERAGLSRTEAAARVGYKRPDMIEKIENDKANPSFELLDKLSDAYGIRIGDLLPNSGGGKSDDLCAPILSAMIGLDSATVRELIRNLSEQARIQVAWRRRDESRLFGNPERYTDAPKDDGEAEQAYVVGAGSLKQTHHAEPSARQDATRKGRAEQLPTTKTKDRR